MARLILGHTTATSIKIWVRASERWPIAFVSVLREDDTVIDERKLVTDPAEFHCSVIEWGDLQPGTRYRVKVAFGKTLEASPEERIRDAYTEGRFRTFDAPESADAFSFLFGSCNLHSIGMFERPDTAWMEISKIAKTASARFMLHCGDQIYADIPFNAKATFEHYRSKYLDAWDECIPAKRVLSELPHYMILDDHEITNNFDLGDDEDNKVDLEALANVAMKVYWEFQHSHNPNSGSGSYKYYYAFRFGSVHFFALDSRYERNSDEKRILSAQQKADQKRILSAQQEADFLQWLSAHPDDLKFVVSSVPFVAEARRPKRDKWCDPVYDGQRARILQHIVDGGISRVVFLTGDMHNAYHATLDVERGGKRATIHELMSSPINQVTPNTTLERKYVASSTRTLPGGTQIVATIDPASYYGNHSNVMRVSVRHDGGAPRVEYQIHRTTKSELGPAGSFQP